VIEPGIVEMVRVLHDRMELARHIIRGREAIDER
jgi:hypothetical protein